MTPREALAKAVEIAGEAQREWDAAPSGMKAGKLLIALAGGLPFYRADIDAIHAVLAQPEQGAAGMVDTLRVGDGSGDAAIAIGEDAFKAGVAWAVARAREGWGNGPIADAAHEGWSEYEPPEHIKALS